MAFFCSHLSEGSGCFLPLYRLRLWATTRCQVKNKKKLPTKKNCTLRKTRLKGKKKKKRRAQSSSVSTTPPRSSGWETFPPWKVRLVLSPDGTQSEEKKTHTHTRKTTKCPSARRRGNSLISTGLAWRHRNRLRQRRRVNLRSVTNHISRPNFWEPQPAHQLPNKHGWEVLIHRLKHGVAMRGRSLSG